MPPRYAYWTILVDEQPTAFRAALQDDLMPTFKRLREKHPFTRLVWFQNGKVWNSRLDAQEAMRERGERGRSGDKRQGGFRSQPAPGPRAPRTADRDAKGQLEWKPKGEADAKPARKLDWQPKGKLEWSPRGKAAGHAKTSRTRGPRTSRPQDPADKRDKRWRPGGEHRDPRQKYKDAKKAKWTRFKQTIRKRWETKQGRKKDDE